VLPRDPLPLRTPAHQHLSLTADCSTGRQTRTERRPKQTLSCGISKMHLSYGSDEGVTALRDIDAQPTGAAIQ
jgi:hypothetical protein